MPLTLRVLDSGTWSRILGPGGDITPTPSEGLKPAANLYPSTTLYPSGS